MSHQHTGIDKAQILTENVDPKQQAQQYLQNLKALLKK